MKRGALFTAALLAASAAIALADCPNACSGHGDCGTKDQCVCYDGFFGGDCSQRVCPLAAAFVDIPRGDLNHDGKIGYVTLNGAASKADSTTAYSKVQWSRFMQYEAWPTIAKTGTADFASTGGSARDISTTDAATVGGWSAQTGEAHFVMECSGKGVCDRDLGVCKCYDGYTGSACQRTTCPNDCSGHGLCRTVREIAVSAYDKKFLDSSAGINTYGGITAPYEYRLWDADANSACVCDIGYGGIDCSLRECPRGDDPLTQTKPTCGGQDCRDEVQSFSVDGSQYVKPGTYYFIFTDYTGVTYKTNEFSLVTGSCTNPTASPPTGCEVPTTGTLTPAQQRSNEAAVKAALEALPNNVTGVVKVTTSADYIGGLKAKNQMRMSITFTGKSGNVPELKLGWTGTSNTATLRAFVFQPGQPLQVLPAGVAASLPAFSASTAYRFRVSVFPLDQTLYGDPAYWSTTTSTLAASTTLGATVTEADVADLVVSALNSIPAIKLAYGTPFVRDGNVFATCLVAGAATASGCEVRVAMPDKQFGLNKMGVQLYTSSWTDIAVVTANDVMDGTKEHATCSNRGLCDYSSGLCSCFTGHTGVACEVQSTLAL